jgi:hypothetical protein
VVLGKMARTKCRINVPIMGLALLYGLDARTTTLFGWPSAQICTSSYSFYSPSPLLEEVDGECCWTKGAGSADLVVPV